MWHFSKRENSEKEMVICREDCFMNLQSSMPTFPTLVAKDPISRTLVTFASCYKAPRGIEPLQIDHESAKEERKK